MRNVLQLGLHTSAEWAYLTRDNWVEEMQTIRAQHRLPDFYTQNAEPFRYFGVDVSPGSIRSVQENYKEYNNVFFIVCGVGDKHSISNAHNKFYEAAGHDWYEFHDERHNSLFIFAPLRFLIENLMQDLTVLAIDIDGHEDEALADIQQWSIKPEFITLETTTMYTGMEGANMYVETLVNAGYTHIKTMLQYDNAELREIVSKTGNANIHPYMHEQHFLRNDIYDQHEDTIEISHIYRDIYSMDSKVVL